MRIAGAFGLNFTALVGCAGFLLMSLMASHWVSIDSDLVLHILYGRAVLEAGLPASDPLLSGLTSAPVLQEWLFEVLVAWLDQLFGLAGPLLLSSVLMGGLMAGQFRRMRHRGVCLWVALLFVILVLFTLRIHLIIRPHLVSWVACVLLMSWLQDWQSGHLSFRATLWRSVLLMLPWANMHGGFLIGLAVAGVFVADCAYRSLLLREPRTSLVQAAALLLALLLASLANPWGWNLHVHLLTFLNNDFLMNSTADFLPPRFENGSLVVLLVAMTAVLLPLLAQRRQVVLRDWLLGAGLAYAALSSARNIPFFGLLMLPLAAGYLEDWLEQPGNRIGRLVLASSGRLEEDEGQNSGIGWPLLIVLLSALLLATGTIRVGLHSQNVPEAALDWVNGQPQLHRQPVFADYMFAGYLLYGTPVQRVYLHALNANYPPERLADYFAVENRDEGWERLLDGLDWAMLRAGEGHASSLAQSPCWQTLYTDEQAAVFQRRCEQP